MVHVSLGVVFLSGKSGAITEVCAHLLGPNVSPEFVNSIESQTKTHLLLEKKTYSTPVSLFISSL